MNTSCATGPCGGTCLAVLGNAKAGCVSWAACAATPAESKAECTAPLPWYEQTTECYKAAACTDIWSSSSCDSMWGKCAAYMKTCNASLPFCKPGYAPAKNDSTVCCPETNPYDCPDKLCYASQACK